jgi:hypothetical protein
MYIGNCIQFGPIEIEIILTEQRIRNNKRWAPEMTIRHNNNNN